MFQTNFIFIFLFLLVDQHLVKGWLLFPTSTIFQITASVSAPVELKDMKFYFDWGFQVNYALPFAVSNFYNIPKWPGHSRSQQRDVSYEKYGFRNGTHPFDTTAGEMYIAIEELMISYGFHETCLLKSVCEIAQHPFDLQHENLIAEIINFVLSPSLHNAFDKNEMVYKNAYEAAELYGANGGNCNLIFSDCDNAFVNVITKVIL